MQVPVDAARSRLALATGLLLCATHLSAQPSGKPTEGIAVPANGVGKRFGLELLHAPCSFQSPHYYHCLFTVPASLPRRVWSVALRGCDVLGMHFFPAFSVDVEVAVGHSSRQPSDPSYDLATNRSADFQIVMKRRTIHFPQTSDVHALYRFPFERPFAFRSGETGIIEFRVFDSTLCIGDRRLTFEYYEIPRASAWSEFGTRCSSDFGGNGNWLHAGPMNAGNPGDAVLAGALGLAGRPRLFGGLRKDAWAGLRLPFRLDTWGAPGCAINSSLDWEWPPYWEGTFSSFKYFALDLPNDASFVGQKVYLQGVIPTFNNALGLETSNGCEVVVGPHLDPPLSYVLTPNAHGNLDGGQRFVGHGPVVELWGR